MAKANPDRNVKVQFPITHENAGAAPGMFGSTAFAGLASTSETNEPGLIRPAVLVHRRRYLFGVGAALAPWGAGRIDTVRRQAPMSSAAAARSS
jgi:hypothetical protein